MRFEVEVVPPTMLAVVLTGHGGIDKLSVVEEFPTPVPAPGEVLIKVHACGMNNTDINTRTGWYSAQVQDGITLEGGTRGFQTVDDEDATWGGVALSFPRIQGADVAGHIVAVGDGVDASRLGERVITDGWLRDPSDPLNPDKAGYYGSERDGGFAQFTTVPAENAHAVASKLTSLELASFNCSYATGENLLTKVRLGGGDVVLITGASGGVGSAMVQLAKLRGATVIAMCSEAKFEAVRSFGADFCLPRETGNVRQALRKLGFPDGVDVVADVVGGPAFASVIDALKVGGRYGTSGAIAGPDVGLNLRHLIYRDLEFHGATFLVPDVFEQIVGYIESNSLRSAVAASYPLRSLGEAQAAFIEKRHTGNFVIEVDAKLASFVPSTQ